MIVFSRIAGVLRLVFFAAFIFCAFGTTSVVAKDGSILTLTPFQKEFNIAPYSYVTSDPDRLLSPDTLMNRYKSNLRGTKIYSDIINLNNTLDPIWIVFTVYNKTAVQDWVLDFGKALDGRLGMVKNFHILNHSTKQALSFPEKSGRTKGESPFIGSALILDLRPGTQNTFIIQLEAQEGFPLSFNLKLLTQDRYMRGLMDGNVVHVIATLLFIGVSAFFITGFVLRRNKSSLLLASYYVILCALFFNFGAALVTDSVISGGALFALYIAGYVLLNIATGCFCHLKYNEAPLENVALIALVGIMVLGALLYLLMLGTTPTGLIAMNGLIIGYLVALIVILFFSNDRPFMSTLLFGGALAIPGIAFTLLTLMSLQVVIMPNSGVIAVFWLVHLVQACLFISAYIHDTIYQRRKDLIDDKERVRDEQSLARLQKSKESADQARLIRVIERERELMAELREREVKRTEEMRISKESADRANKAKSAFLAVVSHEIRTPMNGILGMVQLLFKTTLSKSQLDYVETIRKSSDTMMALLNDILDFEKIERGSMALEIINFDTHRLINDVVILMSGHAAQKGISLNSDIEDSVPRIASGDPTRLRQILLNLINNAVKFTGEGIITVRLEKIQSERQEEKDKIRFSVIDTGIGVSEEEKARLFTPFAQAKANTTRKYGGTGLGLTISYKLTEAMGSHIEVDSIEGKGSTFSFDLDLIIPEGEGEGEILTQELVLEERPAHDATPMKILVTEDNELNRKVLEGLLSQKGHTLYMAKNGLEALEICRAHVPELVFMDIQMDGLNGIETTRQLRAQSDPKVASIPVIALTGNVMIEDIEEYFEVGMNGFIAKPIDSNKLDEVIYNASMGKFENEVSSPIALKLQEPDAEETQDNQSILDQDMLEQLLTTLKIEQFITLLEGFQNKADELIDVIEDLSKEEDTLSVLYARAHELKGLSGNFGMKDLSEHAAEIEKAARSGKTEDTLKHIKGLHDIGVQTRKALDKWAEENVFS